MDITRQRWKVPEYSKSEINRAGKIFKDDSRSEEEKNRALIIIDNWRASHAYPLHVFYMNLRGKAGSRADILVAERLKRLESIVGKLKREHNMQLCNMQDLGGCRMILPTVNEVYAFRDKVKNSDIRHKLTRENDYIMNPKTSGYRSVHLAYRFVTDTPSKDIYNQYPMLIELQFRTHLQHLWATALETIGLFTNQALKAGCGNEEILRFFVVVSSLFAIHEKCPVVPGTCDDKEELIKEIRELDRKHHILDKLRAIRVAIDHDTAPDKNGYYLLRLDYQEHRLKRWFFKPSQLEEANVLYDVLETGTENQRFDLVLVRAKSYSTVKAAYPNYFMDIGEFIGLLERYFYE